MEDLVADGAFLLRLVDHQRQAAGLKDARLSRHHVPQLRLAVAVAAHMHTNTKRSKMKIVYTFTPCLCRYLFLKINMSYTCAPALSTMTVMLSEKFLWTRFCAL